MSEAGSVPFTETKSPESPERLHKGALGLVDIAASTMANIGPAYSFYFGFAGNVIMAGLGPVEDAHAHENLVVSDTGVARLRRHLRQAQLRNQESAG